MRNHLWTQVFFKSLWLCFIFSNFHISCLLFLLRISHHKIEVFAFSLQIERPGTGNQGHHAWAPAASVAHLSDAPEPADPHSR